MNDPSRIRIGHDERDAAIKALDVHMGAGRLDPDEYGERVGAASVARLRTDLDALFDDLPEPHPFSPFSPPPPMRPRVRKGPAVAAGRAVHRFADATMVARIGLVLLAFMWLMTLPVLAVAAVFWFLILPMLGVRGRRFGGCYADGHRGGHDAERYDRGYAAQRYDAQRYDRGYHRRRW